jgi:hypothetical protein
MKFHIVKNTQLLQFKLCVMSVNLISIYQTQFVIKEKI